MTDVPATEGGGVQTLVEDSILFVTVDGPHDDNRLRPQTLEALNGALRLAEENPAISGMVLRSTGTGSYSGGVFEEEGVSGISPRYKPAIGEFFERWAARTFPVLTVARSDSIAYGSAIALTSDLLVATEDATFSLPEMGNGLVPVYAIALMSTRRPMPEIRNMVMTRRQVPAAELSARGVVTDLVIENDIDRCIDDHLAVWRRVGRDVTAQAMTTFDTIDAADRSSTRAIADDGLEQLYALVRAGRSDQGYLAHP